MKRPLRTYFLGGMIWCLLTQPIVMFLLWPADSRVGAVFCIFFNLLYLRIIAAFDTIEERKFEKLEATSSDAFAILRAIYCLMFPFVVIAAGWRITNSLAEGPASNLWWDQAGDCIYTVLALTIIFSIWQSRSLFRLANTHGRQLFATAGVLLYLTGLYVWDLNEYFHTKGPFP